MPFEVALSDRGARGSDVPAQVQPDENEMGQRPFCCKGIDSQESVWSRLSFELGNMTRGMTCSAGGAFLCDTGAPLNS